jgi:hypothetical protein
MSKKAGRCNSMGMVGGEFGLPNVRVRGFVGLILAFPSQVSRGIAASRNCKFPIFEYLLI